MVIVTLVKKITLIIYSCLVKTMCLIQFSSLYKERDREGCTGEEGRWGGSLVTFWVGCV